uniref:Uncharacterized protein n=1 Tax=Rhizophora mucronata TaxID=61149 RepID=A0A2P2QW44_RHIMU
MLYRYNLCNKYLSYVVAWPKLEFLVHPYMQHDWNVIDFFWVFVLIALI